ncbi:MAG: pyrroloquinoline quinone-dependent dehydrogenase [Deltaproteobacteria bacterium]|nr:pyrroloquinoline quinone-dependent dehydrogenase [Deltaproteobacteria bacterium]
MRPIATPRGCDRRPPLRAAAGLIMALLVCAASARAQPSADWPYTEGAAGGGRYSPLADINRGNVASLRVAWTYRHGDVFDGGWTPEYVNKATSFESTPIVVDGRLIFTTPYNRVIALEPESGRELWTYDPHIDIDRRFANSIINRGVAYWRDANASGPCAARVFLGTLDARLIAIDAATGRPCADFGSGGAVDLLAGLTPMVDAWEYNLTSPPTVVGDVVVVGSSIADTLRRVAPPGDVRGFDARSGARRWIFHTIPRPGALGNDTWEHDSWRNAGAANVWSTITADPARGLVFLPVSTPSPDFDGVDRPGANLFSDSVVALRAASGEHVWHFQTIHHDLWDYDLAAPPLLATRAGRDVVVQATKAGFVFVLDRDTGAPVFPVEERPVPPSDLPGEHAWPTQPMPVLPPPLLPARLREDDLWDADPQRLEACRELLRGLRNEGVFTPPSLQGTLLFPSTGGGVNWSGVGLDPAARRIFVPLNNIAHVLRLSPMPAANVEAPDTITPLHFFPGLWWALTGRGTGLRYWTDPLRGRRLFAVDGVPCNRPPWGELVAIDLDAGAVAWRVPAGSGPGGVAGLSGYGPPLVTAGGLVFHAGTRDLHLRAHDTGSGAVLASFELPAGLHAGPITYKLRPDGRQFLVIAPGGHIGIGSKQGDYVIAYTLPEGSDER